MDAIGCIILPRTPIIPKSKALIERLANETVGRFTFNATSKNPSLEGPAPCYLLGRPELAYVYFGVGLLTAIVIALIVDSPSIFRFFVDLCTCKDPAKEQEEDGESEELLQATAGEDSTDKVKANPAIDNTVLNRVRELERKKAGQARIWAYIIAAASELTLTGQTWMLLGVVSSGVSHAIYLSLVSNKSRTMEACATRNDWLQWTNFAMNIFLAIYFLVRAAGSEQKLRVVLSLHSFGDYFNVPNALINPFLSRQFTGFGFMRFFNYLWLIEILTNTGLLRSANKIRLVQLILKVLALISIAAGFLHLAENLGDPWLDDLYNGQQIMFWKCFLYVYGRVTLLDLSGMRLHTTSGRVIIYSFQLLALGVIAKALPEILTHFKVQPAYDKGYKAVSSYLHVIVTGNVTYYNMKNIVQEFYHGDRTYAQHFKIVMLSDDPPDENMQRLLKRFYTKLEYKRGTVMKLKDLERIKVMDAAATLILSNSNSLDADADDAANIMRVVSIKNVKSDARVIVQLNHHQNKAYLQNIPSWSPLTGDTIICLAELRLGLLAQSCIAPGFSTLMANLFTTRTYKEKTKHKEAWMADYERGTAVETYYRKFSRSFVGMTFEEACLFCYQRFNLVLLATQHDPEHCPCVPLVFGVDSGHIEPDTVGFFMADHKRQAEKVQFYCHHCHADVDVPAITKCSCEPKDGGDTKVSQLRSFRHGDHPHHVQALDAIDAIHKLEGQPHHHEVKCSSVESKVWSYISSHMPENSRPSEEPDNETANDDTDSLSLSALPVARSSGIGKERLQMDSSGMFYWAPAIPLSSVALNRQQAIAKSFHNHIILCILTEVNAPSIGVENFILPLRSTSIPQKELNDIVIVTDRDYLEKEWKNLSHIPDIFLLEGNAMNRGDLRAASLGTCKMCIIVGAPTINKDVSKLDSSMLDRAVVLATLNIKAMCFSREELDLAARSASRQSGRQILWKHGSEIPLITDLVRESNAVFLDDDDDDIPKREFYLTQPYGGGRAFSASVLDLLMIMAFFNPFLVQVVESMIFGGVSSALQRVMAEGIGLIGGQGISTAAKDTKQVRVVQLCVEDFALNGGLTYGEIFVQMLQERGIIVLGIFRLMDSRPNRRFVMCKPSQETPVRQSDLLIALQRPA